MSQVRKFSTGAKTQAPSEKKSYHDSKYGHYIVDGKTYDVNDDFINNYITSAKQFGDAGTSKIASHVITALKSGQDVSFDTLNNRVTGINQYLNADDVARSNEYYSGPQNKKMRRQYQRKEINKNSDLHQTNVGIKNLGSIQFTSPEEKAVTQELTNLYGDSRSWDYNKNSDGTTSFSTGPQNAGNLAAIDKFFDFLGMSNEDADKKYGYSGNEQYISELRDWYKTNQNYDRAGLFSRIKSNTLDGNDWDLLSRMGFVRPEDSSNSSDSKKQPRSYEGSGFDNKALEQAGYYVKKDKDGNVWLHDNEGNVVQDKIYLKDTPWASGTSWDGGAVYQGKFWTPDQIFNQNTTVSKAIGSELFNRLAEVSDPEAMRQTMLNSGWNVYGMKNPINYETFDSSKHYLKGFTDVLNDGTYYWNDVTGNYQLNDGDNTKILQVLSGANRDRDNDLKTQYAVSGHHELFDTIEQLQNYLNTKGITQAQGYRSYSPISQYNTVINNGKRYILSSKKNDIAGKEYNLYRDEEGRYYTDGNNGTMKPLKGSNILDAIKNNTVTAQALQNGYLWQPKTSRGSDYTPGSYDQVFGFKKGGTIPSMGIGGFFSTGSVGKNKEKEQVENWVGKPQQLDADKRLKTETDTLNKTAGWLDAAGLATSWIPFVGTGVGLLGSLARFGADVKEDGFQWKDAGNLAINLGLDALTLIPGLGSVGKAAKVGAKAAKAAKAAKLVKASDKVAKVTKAMSPLMSAAGATTGVAQIAGALDNPEGMTSEDFGNLLSGFANIGFGGKNLIKNYKVAKVAKSLAGKKSVKTKDAFKIEDGDNWIKRNAKKVGNFGNKAIHVLPDFGKNSSSTLNYVLNPFKQAQIDDLIGSKWKTLARSRDSFKQSLAAEYLAKNPIRSAKARTVNGRIYNGKQVGEFPWRNPKYELTSRKKSKPRSTPSAPVTPAPVTPAPVTSRPVHPRKSSRSAQDQNLRNLTAELLNKIRKVNSSEGTRNLVSDVGFRGTSFGGQRLPNRYDEILAARPDLRDMIIKHINNDRYYHGSGIDDYIRRFNLSFKQGGKIIKAQPGTTMPYGTFVTDNSSEDPNLYNYSKSGIQFNGSDVDWAKTYGQGLFSDLRNYYINSWDNETFAPIKNNYITQLASGNNNVDLSKFTKDDFIRLTQDQKLGYAHNLWTDALKKHLYNTGDIFKMSGMNINNNKDLTVPFLNSDGTKMSAEQTESFLRSKGVPEDQLKEYMSRNFTDSLDGGTLDGATVTAKAGKSSKSEGTGNGTDGLTKKPFNFKVNPDDLIGLGQMLGNIVANNKMYNRLEEGIKSARGTMEAMPTEIYDRYQDHITPVYQEAAKQKRQSFVPTSTDTLTNYAMRQANEDTAEQLLTEGRLKASEAYSQYLDKDLAARRAYADERRKVGQSNRERMANISMQLAQNDAARRMANWQSINNGVLEFRNKLAQDRQRKMSFMEKENQIAAQQAFNNYVNDELVKGKYYDQFNALDATVKKNYLNAQDWLMQTNPSKYEEIITGANAEKINYLKGKQNDFLDYFKIKTTPITNSNKTPVTMQAYVTMKKGGKTPTYTKRHTGPKPDEAIWVQRNKDTAKALEKLHDAVIKLFMKTIS